MSLIPPIVRHAEALMRDIEESVLRFPKRHQHVSGQQLRAQIFEVAKLANQAWKKKTRRLELVLKLDEAVADFGLLMQLASGLRAFGSMGQFEKLSRQLTEIGMEVGGWKRQLLPKSENDPARAQDQSAVTLSTASASKYEAKS